MTIKRRRLTTPLAAQPSTPTFDPATWANQPRLLASNQAEAEAIEAGALGLGLVLAGALAAWGVFDVAPGETLVGAAVGVALAALITLARWARVYSTALRADTEAARQATWLRELDEARDLDGDGVIGDPFRTIAVRRQDGRVEAVPMSLPRNSARHQPVMTGWGVTAADLVAILYEAELSGRGLQERSWVGRGVEPCILPSGRQVTQIMFRQVLAALEEHEMASKRAGRWELDVTADDVAETLRKADVST